MYAIPYMSSSYFCTQETGDIKINELNSGTVEKLQRISVQLSLTCNLGYRREGIL